MKQIIFGTQNKAKVDVVKNIIKSLPLEILSIKDIINKIPSVEESGSTPLENAVIKAKEYFRTVNKPVFSIDSGLYIDNFSDEDQPGVYVRRVNGRELNDDEMIEYYSNMFSVKGDSHAHYKTAVALITKDKVFTHEWKDYTYFTSMPSSIRVPGHPLTSLEICLKLNKYYTELTEEERENNTEALVTELYDFFSNLLKEGHL